MTPNRTWEALSGFPQRFLFEIPTENTGDSMKHTVQRTDNALTKEEENRYAALVVEIKKPLNLLVFASFKGF
jgi:hypothetical protein